MSEFKEPFATRILEAERDWPEVVKRVAKAISAAAGDDCWPAWEDAARAAIEAVEEWEAQKAPEPEMPVDA
jgi:hypothetical protein